MLFTSSIFIVLLLTTFILYYIPLLRKYQIGILIIASLLFYSYNNLPMVILLLFSVAVNIVSSYYIVYGKLKHQKLNAVAGVTINLLVLSFFKYAGLLALTFGNSENKLEMFLISLPLPIGISFFTFQGISLIIDVYRGKYMDRKKLVPQSFTKHAWQILFFKGFFPQLISGPIVKAHEFIPQIEPKYINQIDFEKVFKNLVLGYFLKMVIADNLKDFTFYISFPYFQTQASITLIFLLIGFSFQIFSDFAGYSLIAIGFAKLFGYHFNDNFNFPYIASSFKDFWKRWHISLSTFLMEYLYFPLGGNRKGKLRMYLNLLIVMALGGLWHGAAWSYMIWGGVHGLALVIERMVDSNHPAPEKITNKIIRNGIVFIFVTLAWLLFKLPEFDHVIQYFCSIKANCHTEINYKLITYIILYSIPVVLYHAVYLYKIKGGKISDRIQIFSYASMLFLILVNSGSTGAFIYFQF